MASFDPDRDCVMSIGVSTESLAEIKKMLDPVNALGSGCRVIKRPDCCILCAANNDCARVPMHVRCHCKREAYLSVEEVV